MITNYGQNQIGVYKPAGIWTPPRLTAGTPPVGPTPADKAGALWGWTARAGITRVGTAISAVADASGNGRNTLFAAGKEAIFIPGYFNGRDAIQFSVTTLGEFGLDALWDLGSPRGLYLVLQNMAEGGTYYHTFLGMRTSVSPNNFNFVASNDPSYGLFMGIVSPGAVLPKIDSGLADITTDPASLILNWDGVSGTAPSSFQSFINNALRTMSAGSGGNNNSGSANFVNSYDNAGGGAFPATDCLMLEAWLYDSPISSGERASIFKPFTQDYYGIPQS